jgi:hypothetical protein
VAAVAEVTKLGVSLGLEVVPGIEITAVLAERDVHVLGYFFDPDSEILDTFLKEQRADRFRRVQEMGAKLASLGKAIDIEQVTETPGTTPGRALGRPLVAAALVQAGHAADMGEAFDKLIGEGRPAYVARRGSTPAEVVKLIHRAGGIASLAHPGLLGNDPLIPELVEEGLMAIEVYHSDHDPATTTHYLALAARYDLVVSGGSDYHGEIGHRRNGLGVVVLPDEHYRALKARARR